MPFMPVQKQTTLFYYAATFFPQKAGRFVVITKN